MKQTTDEALNEIHRRGRVIKRKYDRKMTHLLSVAAFVLTVALVVSLSAFAGPGFADTQSSYGSFLISAESGGYVLVAVLAFVLGITVTLLIQRYRKGK